MKKCAVLALMTASLLAEEWEVKIVRPQETSPARYAQVAEEEIRWLARKGWELVSVSPFALLNEERGPQGHEETVTQTYPAYYLKRSVFSDQRWDVRAVFPREISPARYAQVPEQDIQHLASRGWQLVSVAPYVILNEERGPQGQKLAVTQVYPAYFFQRPRALRRPDR
jgi:hypothetical protein